MKEIKFSILPMIKEMKKSPTAIAESIVKSMNSSFENQGLNIKAEVERVFVVIKEK